jgi:hypothetical protein
MNKTNEMADSGHKFFKNAAAHDVIEQKMCQPLFQQSRDREGSVGKESKGMPQIRFALFRPAAGKSFGTRRAKTNKGNTERMRARSRGATARQTRFVWSYDIAATALPQQSP